MQIIGRKYSNSVGPDASVRQDHEYVRKGVQHLLGALNVKTGRVHGRVVPKRDANALLSFMKELGRVYRGKKVVVIWDNLNIHHDGPSQRWSKVNADRDNRFEFVYTPLHASWVNQIEQWFSILQRRLLKHRAFSHAEQQRQEVEGFIRWWNTHERRPFRWTFDGTFEETRRAA